MKTILDERTRNALSLHLGKNHNSSNVWLASKRAHTNTVQHANPYFNAAHEKIYPEKTQVLILPIDIALKYFFQGGVCYYSKIIFDLDGTINDAYHPNGISPNRKLNGLANYFSPSNTVLVTQTVMRDKAQRTEIEYLEKMCKSPVTYIQTMPSAAFINQFNSELNLFIRSIGGLDHITQVSNLINELRTLKK